MIRYGYEVIEYDYINFQNVQKINEYYTKRTTRIPMVVQVKNTKKIVKDSLNKLNSEIIISIVGPYSEKENENNEKNF